MSANSKNEKAVIIGLTLLLLLYAVLTFLFDIGPIALLVYVVLLVIGYFQGERYLVAAGSVPLIQISLLWLDATFHYQKFVIESSFFYKLGGTRGLGLWVIAIPLVVLIISKV